MKLFFAVYLVLSITFFMTASGQSNDEFRQEQTFKYPKSAIVKALSKQFGENKFSHFSEQHVMGENDKDINTTWYTIKVFSIGKNECNIRVTATTTASNYEELLRVGGIEWAHALLKKWTLSMATRRANEIFEKLGDDLSE